MFDLHPKVAVVTGAGSGIGAAIATLFARQGARIVVVDINESADATVEAIRAAGGDAVARRCDVAVPDEVRRTFDEVHATYGRLASPTNEPAVLERRIAVECLHCGHLGELREEDLARYGQAPGAPIAAFVKRLTCSACGSHSVRANREQKQV